MKRTDSKHARGHALGLVLLASLALGVGCAGASSEVTYAASLKGMQKPPVLLVDVFSFQASDVSIDQSGPSFTSKQAPQAQRVEVGKLVAEALAAKVVTQLGEVGITSRQLEPGVAPPAGALLAKGQFLTIDEGDQMSRVAVGFGAGSEELKVRMQVYQVDADGGLRRIREGFGEAHGDKMPGMAVPVAAGAAGGTVLVSAAVSGGMNALSEVSAGLDAAAQNLAEQFAERAEKVYEEQGWLD